MNFKEKAKPLITHEHDSDFRNEQQSVAHSGNIRQSTFWSKGQNRRFCEEPVLQMWRLQIALPAMKPSTNFGKLLSWMSVWIKSKNLLLTFALMVLIQKSKWTSFQIKCAPTNSKPSIHVVTTQTKAVNTQPFYFRFRKKSTKLWLFWIFRIFRCLMQG